MDTDRASAAVLAAGLLMSNLLGILSSLEYKTSQLNHAVSAFFALGWPPTIITTVGPIRLTRFRPVKNFPAIQEGLPGFVTNDDGFLIGRFCHLSIFFGRLAPGDS